MKTASIFKINPKGLKFKIGVKEYDEKVNEFYIRLARSLSSFKSIENQRSALETLIFHPIKYIPGEKWIKKELSMSQWDKEGIQSHLAILSNYDEIEDKLYAQDNININFEFMCVTKAIIFYLCKLEETITTTSYNTGKMSDMVKWVVENPDNLDFYTTYVAEKSTKFYNNLCASYFDKVSRRGKENIISLELDEFSRVLSGNDGGKDWMYISDRLVYEGFHEVASIRMTVISLLNGDYYQFLFSFGETKLIMAEVLAIEKYVEFLKKQLIDQDKNANVDIALIGNPKNRDERAYYLTPKGVSELNLQELRNNLIDKKIIHKIVYKDFIKIFNGHTDVKINFVKGLTDVLWFTYFLWEDFEFVEKGDGFCKRLSNCFLLNGEEISTNKENLLTISVMRTRLKKPLKKKRFKKYTIENKEENLSAPEVSVNGIWDAINSSKNNILFHST